MFNSMYNVRASLDYTHKFQMAYKATSGEEAKDVTHQKIMTLLVADLVIQC